MGIVDVMTGSAPISLETYTIMMILSALLLVLGLVLIAAGVVLMLRRKGSYADFKEKSLGVSVAADSQMGDRKYQQDYFLFSQGEAGSEALKAGILGVVCDGMGGMEGGELASRTCAELIYQGFYQVGWSENVCQVLESLVGAANREVAALKDAAGHSLKSGTTVVAAVIRDRMAYWVSAGDSRIYLFRGGSLKQLTTDHNYRLILQERCRAGLITPEQVETDRQREALISYVGKGDDILIGSGYLDFDAENGDVLLLCSDGVCKCLSDRQIRDIISANANQPARLPSLITRAALNGGRMGKHDNTTALVISK